jgi:ribosome-associated protein
MARKPRELELDEVADTDALEPEKEGRGRSERKRASHELKRLGEELLSLRAEQLAALALPERLAEAVAEAHRLTSFGARRRQAQFIGKLMRKLDDGEIAAIRKAVERR